MSVNGSDGSGPERCGPPVEVLLVEDNPGDVRLVEEAFGEGEVAVQLPVATDGVEALETLARRRDSASSLPDLVLLDLNLPRMDGLTVLESIRDDPELGHLPVLVLTSSAAEEDVRASYARSANAYLTKPVAPHEFDSLVDAIEGFWVESATLPGVAACS